ncbi:MAG TPA: VCBS repeat-containing protein [Kofleriaceae bacterium]|jgi:hypothetical protein
MRGIAIAAVFAGLASGCYQPGVADCLYQCNNGACPSGLSCVGGMCTSGTDCTAVPRDGGDDDGGGDARIDGGAHAQCGDHMTYSMGEFCFHDAQSVQPGVGTMGLANPQFADWDGDKLADIVMLSGTSARFWHGNGDGTWATSPTSSTLSDSYTRFVASDFNGDGHEDFFCAGTSSYAIYAGQANAPPAFASTVALGSTVVGMAVGHFTGSAAAPESGVAIAYQQALRVVPVNNALALQTAHAFAVNSPNRIYGVVPTLNGPLDHVSIATVNTVQTLDASSVAPSLVSMVPADAAPISFDAGDFDGDGLTDFVEVDTNGLITVTYGKLATGVHPTATGTVPGAHGGIAVGNFDGDPYEDFAVIAGVSATQSDIYIFRGGPDVTQLVAVDPKPNGLGVTGDWIAAGDFNRDMIDDLVFMTQSTGAVAVLLSNP